MPGAGDGRDASISFEGILSDALGLFGLLGYELVDGRNLEELNSKVKDAYGRVLVHDTSATKSQAELFFEP